MEEWLFCRGTWKALRSCGSLMFFELLGRVVLLSCDGFDFLNEFPLSSLEYLESVSLEVPVHGA